MLPYVYRMRWPIAVVTPVLVLLILANVLGRGGVVLGVGSADVFVIWWLDPELRGQEALVTWRRGVGEDDLEKLTTRVDHYGSVRFLMADSTFTTSSRNDPAKYAPYTNDCTVKIGDTVYFLREMQREGEVKRLAPHLLRLEVHLP